MFAVQTWILYIEQYDLGQDLRDFHLGFPLSSSGFRRNYQEMGLTDIRDT